MNETQQLLAEVNASLRQFMYYPNDHAYTVNALWIAHTHLRSFDGQFLPQRTPRLYFGSKEAGAGKTLGMEITTMMSHHGEMHVNPTQFALVSAINLNRGTIGLDEVDRFFGRGGSSKIDIQTVILAGYKRGATVTRQRNDEVEYQNVHGPFAIAGKNLNRFLTSDAFETLRTRSIVIALERKPKSIHVDKFQSEIHEPRLHGISQRLKRWGQRHGMAITSIDVQGTMDTLGLDNRDEEIWSILFRIAAFAGGDWPARISAAARALVLGQWEDDNTPIQSPAEELLMYARLAFDDDTDFLPSRILLASIMENSPSTVWFKREWRTPMAASKGLADMLRNVYGVERHRETVDGEQVWGYSRDDFGTDESTETDDTTIDYADWDWSMIDN